MKQQEKLTRREKRVRDYLTERDLRKHDKKTADRLRKMGYARL